MDREALGKAIYDVSYITGQFVLRSGATSDRYFDKYLFESDPALLQAIAEHLIPLLPSGTQRLAGLEMGGIPLATAMSLTSGLPALFVRKEAKAYGTAKLAEGTWAPGDRITVVEDVITSGGQAILSADLLRDAGMTVDAIISVIDREAGGREAIEKAGYSFTPLFTMTKLLPA